MTICNIHPCTSPPASFSSFLLHPFFGQLCGPDIIATARLIALALLHFYL
jgi:hypothetical protein